MRCEVLDGDDLEALTRDVPVQLWNSPVASQVYRTTLNLVCRSRRGTIVGVWVCPLDGKEPPAACRASRLLPYASPWVDAELHPTVRHRVVGALTAAVMDRAEAVELPMDPEFSEVAALLEAGVEVLCRHTRMLDTNGQSDVREGYLPTVRNHIRAAGRHYTVLAVPPEQFVFTRAIVGQSAEAVAARRRSGLEIARQNRTLCLAAVDSDGVCRGQVFVLRSARTAILMHSWFDRDGPRGVSSLLVDTAISRSADELGTVAFDFEGSVIRSVDQFMAGFGAHATTYPQVRWQRVAQTAVEFG